MSATIKGTTISLTRGDTLQIQLNIKDASGEDYTPDAGDVIRFALKEDYSDKEPLILKTIDNNTLQFTLVPEDTELLPIGSYRYDIEITTAGGVVDTFIPRAVFNLLHEVY